MWLIKTVRQKKNRKKTLINKEGREDVYEPDV